ncbi:hypothetical protein GCM10007968_10910 [Sporolactobacillus putidus]|uniref:NAD-dependent epimerase/dehydratase domain-containing protein n=1 Tax=Sporolactobacillus putidus TaxID=492735 RepID=A0A917S1D5_9BACL|nr:hypothetical protein GCM10007968_10910 [Sporolactobacillus putidus]
MTGPLEATNEAYALAKISGLKMCRYYREQYGMNFISAMPTNLYGPNDKFNLDDSHVIPALISKMEVAKRLNKPTVELWGTGTPLREFLFAEDLADACVYLMENYDGSEHINIGTGQEISIQDLASLIKRIVGYKGGIMFDSSMPDGTPRKLLDNSKIEKLGWKPKIGLEEGLKMTYDSYIQSQKS